MGRKRRTGPREVLDKTVGRLAEGAGRAAGDKSLEAEGQALSRKGQHKTFLVTPRPNGGWRVQTEGAKRASSVHRTKPEAVAAAKEKARDQRPSQVRIFIRRDSLCLQHFGSCIRLTLRRKGQTKAVVGIARTVPIGKLRP